MGAEEKKNAQKPFSKYLKDSNLKIQTKSELYTDEDKFQSCYY